MFTVSDKNFDWSMLYITQDTRNIMQYVSKTLMQK